jgi:hypothetical protein
MAVPGPVADGDEVGGTDRGGDMSDSGRVYDGTAGSEQLESGTMPSGVDWRLPLPKWIELPGLPRDDGMLTAEECMRANEGEGEGMRGRACLRWSLLRNDMAGGGAVKRNK